MVEKNMVTLTERTIMKSRSGVYSDTSENRRKHRVGQRYGAEKQPEDSKKDDKGFEETMEEFSEMFYNGESSEKLRKYLDSRLGEGTYDRISKETSSRSFEESSERKDYFMGRVEDAFLNKNSKPATTDPAKELEAVNKVIAAINEGKLNLPAAEVMKLSEKKQKLEAAKKQAEKINAGVKANEEKKTAKEAKEVSKKINEAQKKERIQSLDSELEQLEEKREKALRDRFYISSKDEEGEELNRKEINDLSDKIDKLRKEKAKLESKKKKEESSSKKSAEMDSGEKTDSPKEKEKKADEKNSKKAGEVKERDKGKESKSEGTSDGKSLQKRKVELLDKYHEDLDKMNKAHEQEQDRIMKELDDEVDNKKRKELWTSLKEKTNNHNEATNRLWKEYESNLDKLEKEEDAHYDKLSEKEEDEVNLKEETEVYSRVKFDDVPNSGKINLKKYLSEKVRKGVDEKWSNIKNIPTENLKKMEKGLVNDLNKNFEAIKKSQRAELLYSIMKVKGELASRGKETQKKE